MFGMKRIGGKEDIAYGTEVGSRTFHALQEVKTPHSCKTKKLRTKMETTTTKKKRMSVVLFCSFVCVGG
jgi:hypothetical protein